MASANQGLSGLRPPTMKREISSGYVYDIVCLGHVASVAGMYSRYMPSFRGECILHVIEKLGCQSAC